MMRLPTLSRRPTLFARSLLLLALLFAVNVVLWTAALTVSPPRGADSFASLCLIAWTTGLRHALDADHIAAIDNATRKIIASASRGRSRRRQPITVGLFFSLGHSTIVVAVTVAISISISVASRLDGVSGVGGVVGQSVSGSFLIIVAIINSVILARAVRARRKARRADSAVEDVKGDDAEYGANSASPAPRRHGLRTIYVRLAAPLFRLVTQPYHLYPIGLLFGLGFDTASTIALLSISAAAGKRVSDDPAGEDLSGSQGQQEAARWGGGGDAKVVLLALLFTAGMTLVDSVDSVMMVYAYAPPERTEGQRWWALWAKKDREEQHSKAEKGDVEVVQDEKVCQTVAEDEELKDSQDVVEAQPSASSPANSTTASSLSLILTLLSIVLALVIGIIVLLSLIASRCTSCSAAAETHDDSHGDGGGGLAGSWWSFWIKAGDASGYIGAGVVGAFALTLAVWYGARWVMRMRRRRREDVK